MWACLYTGDCNLMSGATSAICMTWQSCKKNLTLVHLSIALYQGGKVPSSYMLKIPTFLVNHQINFLSLLSSLFWKDMDMDNQLCVFGWYRVTLLTVSVGVKIYCPLLWILCRSRGVVLSPEYWMQLIINSLKSCGLCQHIVTAWMRCSLLSDPFCVFCVLWWHLKARSKEQKCGRE